MNLIEHMDRKAKLHRLRQLQHAAIYIESYGLWQGTYWRGDGNESVDQIEPGTPMCAIGTLAYVSDNLRTIGTLSDGHPLVVPLLETLRLWDGWPISIGALMNFSDGLRDDAPMPDVGRLASPEHAARVAKLFTQTATRMKDELEQDTSALADGRSQDSTWTATPINDDSLPREGLGHGPQIADRASTSGDGSLDGAVRVGDERIRLDRGDQTGPARGHRSADLPGSDDAHHGGSSGSGRLDGGQLAPAAREDGGPR